jgi:hypothetical protein
MEYFIDWFGCFIHRNINAVIFNLILEQLFSFSTYDIDVSLC